jgi:REP element-mobilizing transposase RayT
MTAPRQILPGTTYLVTRRCAQRQFLLRPSELTNQVFGYVLAVAARRFGMRVHAFCVLSNHFHLVVTDPVARLPAFEQYLDSLVARALNAIHGRWEAFWAPRSYSAVALVSPDDVVDKAAYALANPAEAGLVRRGQEWPGLWSAPALVGGGVLEFQRPTRFFRSSGAMPEVASLELSAPPAFESVEAFRTRLVDALTEREESAAARLATEGRSFLGRARVLAQPTSARPPSCAPRGQLAPRVASRDKWKRIEALARLVGFLRSYRWAWRARQAGGAGVVFPAGTYLLRVLHGAVCEAPG